MSFIDTFLWAVFPYLTSTIFIIGHIIRYNVDQFGWSAQSSEFLEKRQLKWGSLLFHWGIVFVFFGHVAGIMIPKIIYDTVGVSDHLYHMGALWLGGAAGVATVIGGFLLFLRRSGHRRIRNNSSFNAMFTLVLLGAVVLVGFTATVGYAASGGDFDYRTTISPWFRGLLLFNPQPELMVGAPFGFQLHVILAFALFAVWPFTRLVHVWSLPLEYLTRNYIIFRKMNAQQIARRVK
ncbi:respiratory nitrate reductase subunit gamma [Lederbergia graminis]|uniref:Respiratory nitrate reductase subunit gamma n=1 Tax=Lederbergia graminis TaxID=735518 RepID=A0ABW0LHP4_9BACI|nr:respiratory nitrate reductase subunit gamma [Paenibacillus bovis]HLU21004.1 respiratory nitrate reductase subunit gamma [Bacillaceae bacterium]